MSRIIPRHSSMAYQYSNSSAVSSLITFLTLLMGMALGQAQRDFNSTLEQMPPAVGSPDIVLLRCRFDRTEDEYGSVHWTRGDNLEPVYSQTTNDNKAIEDGYANIVVDDESQVTLSQDGSGDWSEATLTMQVTRCVVDKYQCLITDGETTEQSESEITLTFKAPTVTVTLDGKTFTGTESSNRLNRAFDSSRTYVLSGRYRDAMAYDASPVFTSNLPTSTISPGSTVNYDAQAANCNYGGDTTGGRIRFTSPGTYTVSYRVVIDGTEYKASVEVEIRGEDEESGVEACNAEKRVLEEELSTLRAAIRELCARIPEE